MQMLITIVIDNGSEPFPQTATGQQKTRVFGLHQGNPFLRARSSQLQ